MAAPMDAFDRKILFELDCDSRQSASELARKVKLGRDLVQYRLDRLKSAGILNKCHAMVNPYKLGLTAYKTYLKLESNRERVDQFVKELSENRRVTWLAECYGKWDLIFSVLARTPKEFYELHDRLFSDYNDLIMGSSISTLIDWWWFPKKYLLNRPSAQLSDGPDALDITSESRILQLPTDDVRKEWSFVIPEFTFGTTPDEYVLDELEYGIIQLLSQDARMSVTDIASRVHSTPAIVKYRIQKLEELGVIAGYRVDVDHRVLGMTLFRVQVFLRDYNLKKELELRDYCRHHPHITHYIHQLGECKIEFEVDAKDHDQFNAVIDQVRERFSQTVRSMDYTVVRKDYGHRTPCNIFLGKEAVEGRKMAHG